MSPTLGTRRPNPIAVRVVRLLRREGSRPHVRGLDMLDGTPILDLKPCLSSMPADESKRCRLTEAERQASPGGTP